MNIGIYKVLSKIYDSLDVIYFRQNSPREQILNCISDDNVAIIDICCGTLSSGISIASKKPNSKVIGLDISKPMLRIAKNKLQKSLLENVHIKLGDACNTRLKANTLDYAILALVLHESNEELRRKMLLEIKRILKPSGKLLVMEWEKPKSIWKKIMFLPIKLLEPSPFSTFYPLNKQKYFEKHGYKTVRQYHCNYTTVLELESEEAS